MQNLFHTKMDYVPSDLFSTRDATGDSMFNGTFSEMWENMGGILGNDQDVTNNSLTTSYKTIDTVLDKLINNTGVTT